MKFIKRKYYRTKRKVIKTFIVISSIMSACGYNMSNLSTDLNRIKEQIPVDTTVFNEVGDVVTGLLNTAQVNNASQFEMVVVERVVDGDTIVVNDGNESITVRMIGIDTPESVSPDADANTPEGTLASDYTKAYLTSGTTVYLEYDKDKTDPYDRTLAYVWLTDDVDTSDYDDFCQYNYGAVLLQNTYCRATYYSPNGKYRSWYDGLDRNNYN